MNKRLVELMNNINLVKTSSVESLHSDSYNDSYYHDSYHDVYDDRYFDSCYDDTSRYDDSY